jgi:hypothetical protein
VAVDHVAPSHIVTDGNASRQGRQFRIRRQYPSHIGCRSLFDPDLRDPGKPDCGEAAGHAPTKRPHKSDQTKSPPCEEGFRVATMRGAVCGRAPVKAKAACVGARPPGFADQLLACA